jgi:hypothetical protein
MKTTSLHFLIPAGIILSAGAELVPNGEFQMYKPGTDQTVTATFTPDSFARGVGEDIELAAGTVEYSDGTTGTTVDLPGWAPLQSGNDLVPNGVDGSTGMNLFAAWGGDGRIQSAEPLGTVQAGDVYTISVMVGGPDNGPIQGPLAFHLVADDVQLTPTSSVDPTLPNNGEFQEISRTYDAAAIADHIGASLTIILGVEDANDAGNRVIFDNVSIEGLSAPPAPTIPFVITPTEGSPGNYDFEWDSQEGKLYDLVSSPDLSSARDTWPVWDGRADLAATPPANTLADIPGGGDTRRFFALLEKDVPPPPPLLAEDFEEGTPADWAFSDNGAGTAWSVGTPDGTGTEPAAAANGTQAAGTNMNDNYTASATASLITPAFTVPAGGATLNLSQYVDTEAASGGGDFGSIRLLNAADDTPLAGGDVAPDLQGIPDDWSNASFPLPEAANGLEVKIEFRFESDDDITVFAGFYIDDVEVIETPAP